MVVFQRMIRNLFTLMALCAGVTSIQHAINMEWDKAIMALLVAMVLDALDGATARILKATSEFGAHLDTLSDFMAFGIAPATLLYLWILEESGRVGWIAMLFYVCATAMRLARFNTQQKSSKALAGFFTGVPSPAGAGLLMMPVILWMQNVGHHLPGDRFSPLGMNGKTQKIQDFLTNLKLSIDTKSKTLVLVDGDKLAAVIPHRIDDYYKITPNTKKMLVINWTDMRVNNPTLNS